jgi:hypothetical protein
VTVHSIVDRTFLEPDQDQVMEVHGRPASPRRTNGHVGNELLFRWQHLASQVCLPLTVNQRPPTCLLLACPFPYRHVPEVNLLVIRQPLLIKVKSLDTLSLSLNIFSLPLTVTLNSEKCQLTRHRNEAYIINSFNLLGILN